MNNLEKEVLFDYWYGRLDYNEETAEAIESLRKKGLLEAQEVWAPIAQAPNYSVSSTGRVRNDITGKILKPYSCKGYQRIKLAVNGSSKDFKIHRLVAQAFIDNPDQLPQINHRDEDKSNNCIWNLEWCTNKYNCNYGSKVKAVEQLDPEGKVIGSFRSMSEASLATGVCISGISQAVSGQRSCAGGFVWRKREEN